MAIDIIFKIAGIGLLTAIINIILKKSDKVAESSFRAVEESLSNFAQSVL